MPIVIANGPTATATENLQKQGRYFMFDPLVIAGIVGWVDFGYMPPDARLIANNTVNRQDVSAASREGGPDVILDSSVTSVNISYDVVALTPDAMVQQLHAGSVPIELNEANYADAQAFAIDPATSLQGRGLIIRKRPLKAGKPRVHTVVFHPRVSLTPNGTGDSNGRDTLLFTATVNPYDWTPSVAFTELGGKIGQYGVQFEVPDAQLAALLTALDAEALPSA